MSCIAFRLDQGIVDGDYELVPYQGGADAEGSLNAVHVEPAEASASDPNPALEGKHRSMNRSNFATTVLLRMIVHLRFQVLIETLVAFPQTPMYCNTSW